MTDTAASTDRDRLPSARVIRRRWPGLVWAVPIAALLVVAYLGLHWFVNRGTDVVVTFPSASGVSPGDTKVVENGVEVGKVTAVRIAPDSRRVELTLSLDRRVSSALDSNTQFWMIGSSPGLDLQAVKAAIAGVSIGMAPGGGGTPTDHFVGLDQAPLVPPGTRGRLYYLESKTLGSLARGASVRYHGLEIGKVTGTRFQGVGQFRVGVWINAPYDRMVRDGAEFWTASPLRVKLTGGGLTTQLAPASSVFQGAVQFDLPDEAQASPPSPAGTVFTLFDDQETAAQGDPGPFVLYGLTLTGAAGDLTPGGPVSMLGYQVGEVRSATLLFAASSGTPYTRATIALYPRKLDIDLDYDAPASQWRSETDLVVERLLAQGYRARLAQAPPIIGAHSIGLVRGRDGAPAHLIRDGGPYPAIPVAEGGQSGDLDDILGKVDAIMTKVNRMPLKQIGENVRQLTANVSQITATAKPKVGPLIDKLDATATQLDGAAVAARSTLSGEGANQGTALPDTIRELGEAARSIRSNVPEKSMISPEHSWRSSPTCSFNRAPRVAKSWPSASYST